MVVSLLKMREKEKGVGCTSMLRPVAQVTRLCVCIAFGDAQVDLALAEIEKGSSLPSTEKSCKRQVQQPSRIALVPQTQRS